MELALFFAVVAFLGVALWIVVLLTVGKPHADPPKLVQLGARTEPEAKLWVNRLRAEGIWADIGHVGGVAALSIELGSGFPYEVWVRAEDESRAKEVLGL